MSSLSLPRALASPTDDVVIGPELKCKQVGPQMEVALTNDTPLLYKNGQRKNI